jgi:predicted acylesterase/phospholipase RssA
VEEGKPRRRALAFSGGGLDTVMQLGVAHALLVSRSAAPDYVVGISIGAINAAAIAEVLQAGPEQLSSAQQAALSPAERLPFQVDQLRHFLQTYLELPRTLVNTIMPDSLEVQARDPLKPLELPIHFDRERQAREAANEAKSGLVNLINDLFGIPLTVATGTRILRRILGLAESHDEPNRFRRFRARVFNEALLLLLLWTRFRETAALAGTILWAWFIGPNRSVLRGTQGAATADRLMRQRAARGDLLRALRTMVQWFSMAHLFLLASAGWLAVVVPLRTLLLWPRWLMAIGAALLIRYEFQLSWWWVTGLVLAIVAIRFFRRQSKQPARWLDPLKRKAGTAMQWCAKAVSSPVTRVLQYYGLADGLANTDIIKQLLVRCFDPHYYGRSDLSTFLNRSLDRRNRPEAATDSYRKRLSDYSNRQPAVFVAPIAANAETGAMRVVDPSVPVVDALLAATAVVPFLPAVRIDTGHEGKRAEAARAFRERLRCHREKTDGEWEERRRAVETARREGSELPVFPPPDDPPVPDEALASEGGAWFIDGANISNEAIAPLLEVLRHKLSEKKDRSAAVDIYPVSNLPISGGKLPAREGERFDGVLDVVPRALQLKRFRDASVERRLTELYTKALPPGESFVTIKTPAGDRTFVRANVYPLELEKSVGMNYRLIMGEKVEYAEAIYQTVADGCRATLEAALPSTIAGTGATGAVKCAAVIATRAGAEPLPGSRPEAGPGLSEICSRCALHRGPAPEDWSDRAMLRVLPDRKTWPEWPQRRDEPQPGAGVSDGDVENEPNDGSRQHHDPRRADIQTLGDWPRARNGVPGDERALVSLLFGGGVFRGVFHMGVTNALSEMGLHPDVVAGSSVGSIIAAMIAQVFSSPSARGRNIAHLAATFVSIDRLVLTDRFADFVRRFTLRAADTPIALLDVDYLFRRYDHGSADEFNARMRAVAAGIERLSYVSPFELLDLTRDVRLEQFSHFVAEIRADVQDFLERDGVGQEILGSEPLVNLIEQHVLSGRRSTRPNEDDLFESFRDSGIYFLATATNIDSGELEILGGDILAAEHEASLRYGLLASSAFPAVFRPRKSWEIFRRSNVSHQYIDGGVIDNLPLDAVAQFLDRASSAKRGAIVRRPRYGQTNVPHLIFTASLEIDPATGCAGESGIGDCLEVSRRARTFKYNRKIDAFASTQADLRLIHGAHPEPNLLDLHVVAVKPKWLCSTFGFHPMLGFRRRKQKQSIAHGCASTFATVFEMQHKLKESGDWLRAWGANPDLHLDAQCFPFFDRAGKRVDTPHRGSTYSLQPAAKRAKGQCWFRIGVDCPFSRSKLEEAGVAPQKVDELEEIYWLCGNPATHRPQ